MLPEDRMRLFDDWAARYDQAIADSRGYPFAGYEQVHEAILRASGIQQGMTVLDLGIGTGNLAARFAALGCQVWGLDFSAEMLALAREKLPRATLFQADLQGDWPQELQRPFDCIVSTYVLHEIDLKQKLALLLKLFDQALVDNGRIIIGDIAFPTAEMRQQAQQKWADVWDEDEFYWAADETAAALQDSGLTMQYQQLSSCGGVFVFER